MTLLKVLTLPLGRRSTNQTIHRVGGQIVPSFAVLKIADGGELDEGYYLLYCDESGAGITDTWHETLEEALSQASFEFGVHAHEWIDVEASDE